MKKNNTLKATVLGLALLTGFSSCKKDDGGDDPVVTNTTIITGTKWKWAGATIDPGIQNPLTGQIIDDFSSFIPTCEKDNLIHFKSNGDVISDEGDSKCLPTDPQSTTDNWKFINNETQIEIKDDEETTVLNIKSLTSSELIVSFDEEDPLGDGIDRSILISYSPE